MGDFTGTFTLMSLVFLFGAVYTVYEVRGHWRRLWDDRLTGHVRQLGASIAFFLLVPVAVLLHEFGHMLAAWSTGSRVLGLHYFLYWGYVELIPSNSTPLLAWYISLAGNFISYVLGIACLTVGFGGRKLKPVVRVVLVQLGVLELLQTLIAYPLMSLLPGFHGDWDTIYSFQAPLASWATLVVHVASLLAFVLVLQRNKRIRFLLGSR